MVPFGGYFLHCRNQKFRVFSNSKIFKKCLKINEKFQFLNILRKFCDFLKFYRNFRKNLVKNRENFLNMDLSGVFRFGLFYGWPQAKTFHTILKILFISMLDILAFILFLLLMKLWLFSITVFYGKLANAKSLPF